MSTAAVPAWLQRVADEATDLDPRRLSRLVPPAGGTARSAGVLILVATWDGVDSVLLLQRSAELRSHAGQVAFPGGSAEADDADIVATALREAQEEAGVDPADVEVLATWPTLWVPVSDFAVTPVLGWWRTPRPVRADGTEMVHGALVGLAELADPANRFTVVAPTGWHGPAFEVVGELVDGARDGATVFSVWGFTAGLLDRLLSFGGWEQPWDPDRRVEPAPIRTPLVAE